MADKCSYRTPVGNCPHCGMPIYGWVTAKIEEISGHPVVIHHHTSGSKNNQPQPEATCPCLTPAPGFVSDAEKERRQEWKREQQAQQAPEAAPKKVLS